MLKLVSRNCVQELSFQVSQLFSLYSEMRKVGVAGFKRYISSVVKSNTMCGVWIVSGRSNGSAY